MDIALLGPLQVEAGGAPVRIGAAKERGLLAWLALCGRGGCSAAELTDVLWGEDPPRSAHKAIQTYISNLRHVLPTGLIRTTPRGYVLDVPGEVVDAVRFERFIGQGRQLVRDRDAAAGASVLEDALRLWRGPPLADLIDQQPGLAAASRLEELRRGAEEDLADARLALGEHQAMVGDLQAAVAAEPLRERRWAQLMLALYRSGRQADALRAYRRLQDYLLEELGIDPSADLARLEEAILQQRPELNEIEQPASLPIHRGRPATSSAAGELPSFASSFVGRKAEVKVVGELLMAHRLVSLTGSGGSGKTRLAVAVARGFARDAWTAYFVGLESVEEPRYVCAAFAEAFGMPDPHGASVEAVVRFASRVLTGQRQLILIDNAEHVLEATALLIAELLHSCENVRVLVTSREHLDVAGERVFLVPGLSVPSDDSYGSPAAGPGDSVTLFVQRAQLTNSTLDERAVRTIARICRAVDGIPLAIELVASAASSLPLAELEHRLAVYLKGGGGQRGAVARHRTLAATMQWSFSSLEAIERRVLVALTVFAGSFSLEAAVFVGASEPDVDVASIVGALVRKSLISPLGGPAGIERYQLLTVVKEIAAEYLGTAELLSRARHAHATYFLALAEDADRDVHGPRAPQRLAQVSAELADLRAALRYSIAEGDLETGARLAGALRWFFGRLCLLDECREWVAQVLNRRDELSPLLRVRVLSAAGTLAFITGVFRGVPELTEEAVREAVALGNDSELATALSVRGTVLAYTGELEAALMAFAEAEPLCRRIGDHYGLGWLLTERAVALRRGGDLDGANECLRDALDQFAGMGDIHSMIMPTLHLGLVAQQMSDLEEASNWCSEAVELCRRIGDRQLLHLALCCAARVAIDRGDLDEGAEQIRTALVDLADAENLLALAIGVEGLAIIAARRACHRDSVVLWAYADSLRTRSLLPLSPDRSAERERCLDESRAALGTTVFDIAWQAGSELSRDDAVSLGAVMGPTRM